MKKIVGLLAGFVCLFLIHTGSVLACESYTDYSTDELKELRDAINQSDADPLDRMLAFEKMMCSDSPNMRHYAMEQGMKNVDDPLVRNEIMLKALLEKRRIDVEIGTSKDMTKNDKAFVAEQGGVYSHKVTYRSEPEGCIGLYQTEKCDSTYSLIISGDRVELNYQQVSGTFRLSKAGELVGTIRARNHQNYTQLPAVIKLF